MLEVSLDGNIVTEEPEGLTSITEHLYYSVELSTYLLEINGNLMFRGDEYTYLRSKWDENICSDVAINIIGSGNDDEIDFNGIIKVSDIVWFPDMQKCECEIQDNSITAYVVNNKNIQCVLDVGKTKNGDEYTVTSQTDIEIPNPTDASSVTGRYGVRIFDAFKSIITFVSDGELGFVSDYFDYNSNTDEQVYSVIMTGSSIRQGGDNNPTISFYELFGDVNRLENLALGFEDGNIRIEDKAYFKKQSNSVSFDNVHGLSQELDTTSLYARVTFGSFANATSFTYLQDIRFNGTVAEEYHLGGQCNTDTYLDLTCIKLITDTNIIQDVLPVAQGGTNNSSYDDDVFILHLDSSNKAKLTQKPGSATDYYFNDRFTNKNVAFRWFGQIPQSIYAFLGSGNDGCYIGLSPDQTINPFSVGFQGNLETAPYHDVNGNYSIQTRWFPTFLDVPNSPLNCAQLTLGVYDAPNNAVYSFEIDLIVESTGTLPPVALIGRMELDTITGFVEGAYIYGQSLGANTWRIYGGASFYMNAGEYAGCSFLFSASPTTVISGSTFEVADPLGGNWQTYNSDDVFSIKNIMEYPISQSDWKAIKANPYDRIPITYQTGQHDVWLNDIERPLSGMAQLEMLSKNG